MGVQKGKKETENVLMSQFDQLVVSIQNYLQQLHEDLLATFPELDTYKGKKYSWFALESVFFTSLYSPVFFFYTNLKVTHISCILFLFFCF